MDVKGSGVYDQFASALKEFSAASDSLRNILLGLVQSIEGGTVPPEGTAERFSRDLYDLRTRYDVLYSEALA
ncbi:MAG: hypothetical protein IKS68_08150, partial [Mailhella sp.]|nr:hypothetical protein [Mailhella sp.]